MWMQIPLILGGMLLDAIVFSFLEYCYHLFLLMSTFTISTLDALVKGFGGTVRNLFTIIMLFRIAIELIRYLIDPDKFQDSTVGGAALVKKIGISLVLLVCSGFIFNLANDLQLLLIGNPNNAPTHYISVTSSDVGILERVTIGNDSSISNFGRRLASTILECFLYKQDGFTPIKWSASTGVGEGKVLSEIWNGSASFWAIFALVPLASLCGWVSGSVAYTPIISTIIGIYISFMLVKFTVAVAVRSLKLAVLQIVFPIPVISNMMPGKSDLLSRYTKLYVQTFLELILRVLSLYIGVGLIGSLSDLETWLPVENVSGFTTWLTKVFFIIAVFQFIKILPEFINKLFGSNMDTSKKGGFGAFMGGLGGAVIGTTGGAIVAKKAGLSGGAAAWQALRGGFSGMNNGRNSQDLMGFVSAQAQNLTGARDRAQAVAGGTRNWANTTGEAQTIQRQQEVVNKASGLRDNITSALETGFVNENGTFSEYAARNGKVVSPILGANGAPLSREKSKSELQTEYSNLRTKYVTTAMSSSGTNQKVNTAKAEYNSYVGAQATEYGFSQINNQTDYDNSSANLAQAKKVASTTVIKNKSK